MGGKRKTKWRKLPLEEFTKEPPKNAEKVPTEDVSQPDLPKDENFYTPVYHETVDNFQYYTEPYEYIDGLYYPTSCVVYNPADVGMYSSYMMPVDTCYYYYTVPEMPQMQEYVPMPYQDYGAALPKETVYLLLPTQTVRQPPTVPNVVPEWQNRRRRRRYEGYAEYAIIPEKINGEKVEEKDQATKPDQQENRRRNSSRFNGLKRMSSFSDTENFGENNSFLERNQGRSKLSEMKNSVPFNSGFEKFSNTETKEMNNVPAENNQKRKKSLEVCGIHSKSASEKLELQMPNKRSQNASVSINDEATSLHDANSEINLDENAENVSQPFNLKHCYNPADNHVDSGNENNDENKSNEQRDNTCKTYLSLKIELDEHSVSAPNSEPKKKSKTDESLHEEKSSFHPMSSLVPDKSKTDDLPEIHCPSSLPDILSTLNKPSASNIAEDVEEASKIKADSMNFAKVEDIANIDKGKSATLKSFSSQTGHFSNFEAVKNELEMELTHLKSMESLRANDAIYKLAYDENVTDQSDSRSQSPMDPEIYIPCSYMSNEIVVHEIDSGSEAGSEDVELLPHRYESESSKNQNKHLFVNKLSLAVELLRTQEPIPYDREMKRVSEENILSNNIVPVHTGGKVNSSIQDASRLPSAIQSVSNFENREVITGASLNEIAMQGHVKHSANSSCDSAIFSEIDFGNLEDDELDEMPKEVVVRVGENQDSTQAVRTECRRYGVQARHFFAPRGGLPFNPCFCCIIM